jgi:hypothetical protein
VNTGELGALQTIGNEVFLYCLKLREVEIPTQCREAILSTSGIQMLDLRAVRCDSVMLFNCVQLKKVVLPHAFRGSIEMHGTVSLTSITIGDFGGTGRFDPVSPRQMRFLAYRCPFSSALSVAFSRMRLFGEIAAASRRLGSPSLPY